MCAVGLGSRLRGCNPIGPGRPSIQKRALLASLHLFVGRKFAHRPQEMAKFDNRFRVQSREQANSELDYAPLRGDDDIGDAYLIEGTTALRRSPGR